LSFFVVLFWSLFQGRGRGIKEVGEVEERRVAVGGFKRALELEETFWTEEERTGIKEVGEVEEAHADVGAFKSVLEGGEKGWSSEHKNSWGYRAK
jgi:hypothetical protein